MRYAEIAKRQVEVEQALLELSKVLEEASSSTQYGKLPGSQAVDYLLEMEEKRMWAALHAQTAARAVASLSRILDVEEYYLEEKDL